MKRFDPLRREINARMRSAVENAVQRTALVARALAPVGDGTDGGHLRDCIFARTQAGEGVVSGCVYADNPHALYVEHGTSRMASKPFLHPAFKAGRTLFTEKLNH